jgi:hypothetical protein
VRRQRRRCQDASPRTAIISDSYSAISAFHSTLIRAAKKCQRGAAQSLHAQRGTACRDRRAYDLLWSPVRSCSANSGGWWWVGFGVPQIPLSLSARDRSVARDFIFHPPDSSL